MASDGEPSDTGEELDFVFLDHRGRGRPHPGPFPTHSREGQRWEADTGALGQVRQKEVCLPV